MAEYIELKTLQAFPIRANRYDKEHANEHFINGIETVMEYAEGLPAADVAPVVHGKWINTSEMYGVYSGRCSVCGLASGMWHINQPYKYCPYCGAKMDGGDGDAAN